MSEEYFLLRIPVDEFLSKHPYFYEKIYSDIPYAKKLITKYEYVVTTTISIKYASLEWNDDTCIREFIQNAMDASEEAEGRPVVFVTYEDKYGVTTISDWGRGITEKAILMGGSEKPCWSRGRFGEGMKMSMMYLLDKYGKPTYVFTQGNIGFKSVDFSGVLAFVFFRHSLYGKGTTVVIPHKFENVDKIVLDMSKVPPDKIVFRVDLNAVNCPKPRPHYIISDEGDKLYVADIYVNNMSAITGYRSIYTYNLWWVRLHRGRTAPYSLDDLMRNLKTVSEIMSYDVNTVARFIRPMLEFNRLNNAYIISANPKIQDTFEAMLFPLYMFSGSVQQALAKLTGVSANNICASRHREECEEATRIGITCVLLEDMPDNMAKMFVNLPPFYIMRNVKLASAIDESATTWFAQLGARERKAYLMARAIVAFISSEVKGFDIMPEVIVKDLPANLLGVSEDFMIYLSKAVLKDYQEAIETAIHEMAHIILISERRSPEHLTEDFYETLQRIASTIAYRGMRVTRALESATCGYPFFSPNSVLLASHRWDSSILSVLPFDSIVNDFEREFLESLSYDPITKFSHMIFTGYLNRKTGKRYLVLPYVLVFEWLTIDKGVFEPESMFREIVNDVEDNVRKIPEILTSYQSEAKYSLKPLYLDDLVPFAIVIMYEPPDKASPYEKYSYWFWEGSMLALPSEMSLTDFKLLHRTGKKVPTMY